MGDAYYGFNTGEVLIGLIKILKSKGILEEKEVLDLLWDAKEPMFPWSKADIKELIKL
jgi:hypothetical protein